MTSARKVTVVIAALAIGAAAFVGIANAHDGGLSFSDIAVFTVEDDIRIKAESGSGVIVHTITVAPGKHSAWHYHPGPHFVAVKNGTVRVYETDCTYRQYAAGRGFYDAGESKAGKRHVHMLVNATDSPAEVVITDIRTVDHPQKSIVVSDPPAESCHPFSA